MQLTHRFTVPTSVDETWAHFNDIASVAECFPGATVASVDGDTFSGSVKVRLGPIALVYNGSGTFVEKDEAAHRFVVEAKGKDKRGNGTAGATVTLAMAPATAADAGGATDVEVVTDLAITGKPAQFGRGVMQDVSDKLLGQFVACLEERLSAGGPSAGVPTDETVVSGTGEQPDRPWVSTTGPSDSPSTRPSTGPSTGPPAGVPTDETVVSGTGQQPDRPWVSSGGPPETGGAHRDDSIDLGTAVLPVLAKTYWKQAAGALGALLLLWWLVSRSRR